MDMIALMLGVKVRNKWKQRWPNDNSNMKILIWSENHWIDETELGHESD